MAVNLTGIDLSGAAIGSAHKTKSSQTSATTSQDTASQQADVNITSTAALLARLEHSLASQPAVDQSRVEAISKALASGTYEINPDRITHGLRNLERSLQPLPLKEI